MKTRKPPEDFDKDSSQKPHPATIGLWIFLCFVGLVLLNQVITIHKINTSVGSKSSIEKEQQRYHKAYERGVKTGITSLGIMFFAQSAIYSSNKIKNPTFYYDVLKKHDKEDDDKFIAFRFRDGVLGHLPRNMLGLEDKKGDPDE